MLAYLSIGQLLCVALQSDVYNEMRKSDKIVPWGAPALVTITWDAIKGFNLTDIWRIGLGQRNAKY